MPAGFDSFAFALNIASGLSQIFIALALWRIVRKLEK